MGCEESKVIHVAEADKRANGAIKTGQHKRPQSAKNQKREPPKGGKRPDTGNKKKKNGQQRRPANGKVGQDPKADGRNGKAALDNNRITSMKRKSSLMVQERYGKEKSALLKYINENVIGINATFDGPFGRRKVIYCDFVASGKPVKFIEEFINENVLPFYANTHTTTSVSALQTSTFREESRDIIKFCINATEEDVVIFTGSGSTAAIHKLINAIELKGEKAQNTVVIIGPYEHHSNILPWKVSGAKVERLKETLHGELDLQDLRERLQKYKAAGVDIIVALSAASNVTGIKTDTTRISEIVHEYGGLSFWDYACAGPYLDINMNPTPTGYKDAVFVSVHKFLGGTGTPGLLMAKKKLFVNEIPGGVGGGTVTFVTKSKERYISDIEEREEGGTPAIVESIRAGLAFQLKQEIGSQFIESIEEDLCQRAFKSWKKNKNIQILGSHTAKRLPIFSLLIAHPQSGKFLHHNFVSILLNDLYGIQARGGCACAGPYAMDLLCITEEIEDRIVQYLVDDEGDENDGKRLEVLKPGFARLNMPYFHDTRTVDYIIKAVDRVATDGWKLLPLYKVDPQSGAWQHRTFGKLNVAHLKNAILPAKNQQATEEATTGLYSEGQVNLQEILREADSIFEQAPSLCKDLDLEEEKIPVKAENADIIWFLQPRVALMHLRAPSIKFLSDDLPKLPFMVRRNSLVKARNNFMEAMDHLGYKTDKLRHRPVFYSSDAINEAGVKTEVSASCSTCD